MKSANACKLSITALLMLTVSSQSYAQEYRYLDDRSSAKRVIESFYNAINNKDYPRAYSYWSYLPKSFDKWSAGYAKTKKVKVIFGKTFHDPGAGTDYIYLPVALSSLGTDGAVTIYSGCYRLTKMLNPRDLAGPPYRPIAIEEGHLSISYRPFQSAVPAMTEYDVCDKDFVARFD